jgi:hypothetical protein
MPSVTDAERRRRGISVGTTEAGTKVSGRRRTKWRWRRQLRLTIAVIEHGEKAESRHGGTQPRQIGRRDRSKRNGRLEGHLMLPSGGPELRAPTRNVERQTPPRLRTINIAISSDCS